MRARIIERLKQVGRGYDLDKLPPALLNTIIEAATPALASEISKAEERAIQKVVTEKFVTKAFKSALEGKPTKRSRATVDQIAVSE